jgi:phosphatidylserine/phosphatidylglycerophosphate/cardiolipin synthase-like enzyme
VTIVRCEAAKDNATNPIAMRFPVQRRVVMLLALVLAVGAATVGPWNAQPTAAAAPKAGPTFNDPTGSEAAQMAIMTKLISIINGTPKGAYIRMTFFSFTIQAVADALIAAHRRGVNVRLIMDDHEEWPAWQRVTKVFGTDTTARSFAIKCPGACRTDNDPSYMHSKVWMFSSSGGASRVVMVSSTNPTYFQSRKGWNNAYTMVGDTKLYDAFRVDFESMTAGAILKTRPTTSPNTYVSVANGKHKIYLFPIGGSGPDTDIQYQVLRNIRCSGVASGYGYQGHTVVRVAMYQWSYLRVRLAQQLWTLDDQGCAVVVMYDPTRVDPQVLTALRKSGGRHDGPVLVPASHDANHDGVSDLLLHDKVVLIDGVYAGDTSSRIVFTGSANWTYNSLHYNDEFMLRIVSSSVHSAYLKQFNKVRAWAEATTSPITGLKVATGRTRSGVAHVSVESLPPD